MWLGELETINVFSLVSLLLILNPAIGSKVHMLTMNHMQVRSGTLMDQAPLFQSTSECLVAC